MIMQSNPSYEVKIFIGSKRGYNGESFSKEDLLKEISDFQIYWEIQYSNTVSLRVSNTTYVVKDYVEDGFEITAINYPRFPKQPKEITDFMRALVARLLLKLEQNRISMTFSSNGITEMYESNKAEQTHKP